jgi:hypothetical protein
MKSINARFRTITYKAPVHKAKVFKAGFQSLNVEVDPDYFGDFQAPAARNKQWLYAPPGTLGESFRYTLITPFLANLSEFMQLSDSFWISTAGAGGVTTLTETSFGFAESFTAPYTAPQTQYQIDSSFGFSESTTVNLQLPTSYTISEVAFTFGESWASNDGVLLSDSMLLNGSSLTLIAAADFFPPDYVDPAYYTTTTII